METAEARWESETLFFKGDDFFKSLLEGIDSAQVSIDLEVYIFEKDELGQRVIERLVLAAGRGVKVRVLVDGVGAWSFASSFGPTLNAATISWKVYHELPFKLLIRRPWRLFDRKFFRLFGLVNKRNHRKVCTVDGRVSWVGSFNVAACHLEELVGEKAWRDSGMRVSGAGVSDLLVGFEHALRPVKVRSWKSLRAWYAREKRYSNPLVRLNVTGPMRRRNYRELLLRIKRARRELYVTTAYFVPKRSLVRALKMAAQRGCDVRIVVPSRSDVFFMPWLMGVYYEELLRGGIQVYEYLPSMLHAKTLSIDDWAMVGSTNLNHRSIMHDLEVDLVVSQASNRELLIEQFRKDLTLPHKVTRADWEKPGLVKRLVGRFLLIFRDWFQKLCD